MARSFQTVLTLVFTALMAAILPVMASAQPAQSQAQGRLPASRSEIQLSFAPLVQRAAPAVVNVYTRRVEKVAQPASPLFDDPFFRRFFGDQAPFGPPRERVAQSLGSGVIVEAEGVIVTNNHVIDGATEIVVALSDRREFEARVIAADPRSDLAVLRIDTRGETLPYLEFRDSDELQVGDLVLAIGNPFGVGQTVTQGIISAVGRAISDDLTAQSFIQTDAAINPGNSGGALLGMDGKLVGINTAIFSRSGGSIGIGFAIPANLVSSTVASAMAGKGIKRPWFGASGEVVTSEIAQGLGMARPNGVLVGEVYRGGPADRAGLRTGDVVLAIDGREVNDPQALRFRIATRKLGETAAVDVQRRDQRVTLRIALQDAPETPPRDLTQLSGNQPLAGTTVGNLSPAFAEELGVDTLTRGVIVTEIVAGSPANRLRVRPGDVIVKINDRDVPDVKSLQSLLRGTSQWTVTLRRNKQLLSFTVRG
ncbi:MAG: Do family serine endopeptidase [Ferrovibrio sp.]|uniref:Do family serine endopeptidase n=1 Tax=Ferrovibrio sp. TaxID=1917215 RepID=UPI00261997F3|nr:Do family serine endopeptidase [Ferrovibrio sp.]MCW0234531.1 Do family serine endopeptidase [Ferrovibrio sp.]